MNVRDKPRLVLKECSITGKLSFGSQHELSRRDKNRAKSQDNYKTQRAIDEWRANPLSQCLIVERRRLNRAMFNFRNAVSDRARRIAPLFVTQIGRIGEIIVPCPANHPRIERQLYPYRALGDLVDDEA